MMEQCPPEFSGLQTSFLDMIQRSTNQRSIEKIIPMLSADQRKAKFIPHSILALFSHSGIPRFPQAIFHDHVVLLCGTLKIKHISKNDSRIIYTNQGEWCAGSVDAFFENPIDQTTYAVVNQFEPLHEQDAHINPYCVSDECTTGCLYYAESNIDVIISMESILGLAVYTPFTHSSGTYAHLLLA